MLMALLKNQRGFTLIELLAVMAIVATLAAIVATQVSGSGETSRDVQTQQDATTVATAVGEFFSDNLGAEVLRPRTATVFDRPGINQEISSVWPESSPQPDRKSPQATIKAGRCRFLVIMVEGGINRIPVIMGC